MLSQTTLNQFKLQFQTLNCFALELNYVRSASLTDNNGNIHTLENTYSRWLCDNQEGICAVLEMPELDMVDTHDEEEDYVDKYQHLILPFSHDKCCDASLTRGKGSSLAKLTKFDVAPVPSGFCLTTNFFKQYQDDQLKNCLQNLESAALSRDLDTETLKASCLAVQKKILR